MAGIQIKVDVDTSAFDGKMKGLVKQVPFALSKSINRTAQDAVADLRVAVKKDMTIRGNQWVPKGIQMRASTKTNLVAEVGTVDEFMVKQVEGGTKRGKSKHLAVPLVGKGRARARKKSITPPDKWPSGITASDPDVFVGVAGRKRGAKTRRRKGRAIPVNGSADGRLFAVWRRMPKHKLKMVYRFAEQIEIKDRFEMEKYVRQSVQRNWVANVDRAIAYAIKTAKP